MKPRSFSLKLAVCERDVLASLFRRPENAQYHVFKHVLHRREGWRTCFEPGLEPDAVRKRLGAVHCRGLEHGKDCPSFAKCSEELERFLPQYLLLIEEALQEGASLPRHVHDAGQGSGPSIFFLSTKGVVAQGWDHGKKLALRTAYRQRLTGVASQSDAEYYRDAKEYLLHRPNVAAVHFSPLLRKLRPAAK